MSLYPEDEELYSVYHPVDSSSTKITAYSPTVAFTILLNIIRRNEDTIAVLGEDMGEYVANANGKYANASNIRMGDKITKGTDEYIVVNRPKYVRLFNRYKMILNRNK